MARTAQGRRPHLSASNGGATRYGVPRYVTGGERARPRPGALEVTLRVVGALALLAMAAVHLQRFFGAHYSDIPTIGPLFALNFAGGVLVAVGLMAPLERVIGRRGDALVILLALAGVAIAAASIVFLLVSESAPLFGFREYGYGAAMVVALGSEAVAVLSLAAYLAARARA